MEKEINSMEYLELSNFHIERYCRQIIIPEIGVDGQKKIQISKVLVIGAGGLGSSCLLYLAGAGIGTIGIVDGDCVELNNLHRQIIHPTSHRGINKAKSAEIMINAFNPLIKTCTYEMHLTNSNAIEICKDYDLLIDCCDNPATRYLTSDVSVILNKPLVSGASIKWEGQLTVYVRNTIENKTCKDNNLPCYRCLFPIPTPVLSVCTCSEIGVFGPVPGVIGTLQASEAIKIIIGACDKVLARKLLLYDAYEMKFKICNYRSRREDCIACGGNPKITFDNLHEYDYEEFTNPTDNRFQKRLELPEEQLILWKDFIYFLNEKDTSKNDVNHFLIDVRSKEQFAMYSLTILGFHTFTNIPLKDLQEDFEEIEQKFLCLKKDSKIFVICRAGNHSTHAVKLLIEKGYINSYNVVNGIHGYIKEIDSNVPFY